MELPRTKSKCRVDEEADLLFAVAIEIAFVPLNYTWVELC